MQMVDSFLSSKTWPSPSRTKPKDWKKRDVAFGFTVGMIVGLVLMSGTRYVSQPNAARLTSPDQLSSHLDDIVLHTAVQLQVRSPRQSTRDKAQSNW